METYTINDEGKVLVYGAILSSVNTKAKAFGFFTDREVCARWLKSWNRRAKRSGDVFEPEITECWADSVQSAKILTATTDTYETYAIRMRCLYEK